MGFRNHPHGIEPLVKIGEKSLGRVRGNANFENSDSHPFFSRDAVICDLAWAKILPHVNARPTTGLMQWYSKPHGRTDVQSKVSASKFSATVVSAAVTSWRFSWVAKTGEEEKWGLGLHKLNVENPLNVPQNKYIYHIWGVMHRLRFFFTFNLHQMDAMVPHGWRWALALKDRWGAHSLVGQPWWNSPCGDRIPYPEHVGQALYHTQGEAA